MTILKDQRAAHRALAGQNDPARGSGRALRRLNRLRLAKYGLEDQLSEVISSGVRLAKEAAGNRCYVAGSLGPLPMLL